jgi:hypothetical protein
MQSPELVGALLDMECEAAAAAALQLRETPAFACIRRSRMFVRAQDAGRADACSRPARRITSDEALK